MKRETAEAQYGEEEWQRGRHAWLTAGAGQALGRTKGNWLEKQRVKTRF